MSDDNLIDISETSDNNTQDNIDQLKAELKETKEKLNDALSEVAVAQVLQENLCSIERQKVIDFSILHNLCHIYILFVGFPRRRTSHHANFTF